MKKLRYFYVLEPGDVHCTPVKSAVKISILNIIRSIKERCGGVSPQEVRTFNRAHIMD